VGLKHAEFAQQLEKLKRVAVDSAVLIYHLEDVTPYSQLTEMLFGKIAAGEIEVVLSTVSLTELLVKPFADEDENAINAFETFLHSLPSSRLLAPDYSIAKEAARLRAKHQLRTPDALLLATAIQSESEAFMTNDTKFRKLPKLPLRIVLLDDYV
jgi:predicted nucleic acid-binding protein